MPNWTENSVEITGSKEDIAALKKWAGQDFDFNRMIPCPKELDAATNGLTASHVGVVINEKTGVFHRAYSGHGKKDANEAIGLIKTCNAAMAINNGYKPCKVCMVNPNQKSMEYDKPLEEGAALVKKYGYDNWYDWKRNEWGTKWNCCEIKANWKQTFVGMFFLTAWSPPEPIYDAIVKKFPNLQMTWHYNDPGSCFSGNFETKEEFDHADPDEYGENTDG